MKSTAIPSILLVDDEESICSALRRTFKQNQFRVFEANSGEQALNTLKNHPIDIIVSDQRMPGMTGTELLSIVKHQYPSTGRIILSGHSDINDLTDAINEANIHQFIAKPWNDQQLLGSVNRIHSTPKASQNKNSQDRTPKKRLQPSKVASIEDAFSQKQIDLEVSIKADTLELQQNYYHSETGLESHLSYLQISWPKFLRFQHSGIVNIAKQSGYLNDLFKWYLIKTLDNLDKGTYSDKPLIVDLFPETFAFDCSIHGLLRALINTNHQKLIFRVPFHALGKEDFTDRSLPKKYSSTRQCGKKNHRYECAGIHTYSVCRDGWQLSQYQQ